MDERTKQVLHAIIKDYISTAEPVGSRAVAKKYDLGVSPATIRNEMSDLEELGYIEQPHTSAGRKPSQKGYRYYVDYLMEKESLTIPEVEFIRLNLSAHMREIDGFMRQCCQMISRLTNYAAMILVPSEGKGKLEKLQLLPVDAHQLLVIALSSSGVVRHRLLRMPEPLNEAQIAQVEAVLRERLVGLDMEQLTYTLLRDAMGAVNHQQKLISQTLELMEQVLYERAGEKVFFTGTPNILSQPEFKDVDKTRNILGLLEEEDKLKNLLQSEDAGTHVAIGSELPHEEMKDCSMVIASYDMGGISGSIGVLGPTRMSYPRTISLVEFIANELSAMMREERK